MARRQLGTVIEFIHASLGARDSGDKTDADLLEHFVQTREEAAFTAILQRHGTLVIGVCRRVLGNTEDADDAFQATFLILVRKASSIRKGASVASWLYGVAYRVSLEARTRAARRRAHEQRAENLGQADPSDDAAARELRSILDKELEQLPQKYRDPLILHYLAGKTKPETAQQLGWSEGTVSGRLARARDLLRNRLIRRRLVFSASALSAAFSQEAAVASVSAILASSTVSLATLVAAGEVAAGASTARILTLTESVVHTMFLTKLKIATAVLLLVVAVGLGGGGLYRAVAEQSSVDQEPPVPAQLPADPGGLAKEPAQVKKPGTTFRVNHSGTSDVALSADGKLLARGAIDGVVDVWDVATGKKLHTLKGHTTWVIKVAFSPDGKTLASAATTWGIAEGGPGEIILWDLVTGKERVTLKGNPGLALCLAFSPDGKTLATESYGKKEQVVKLWDVDTGKEKLELKLDNVAQSLAFSPDGKTLAVGTGRHFMEGGLFGPSSVVLWDVTTGKERVRTLAAHTGWISWVGFAPDGKTLASVSCNTDKDEKLLPGQLKLWDAATAKERASIPIRTMIGFQFFSLAFTADGKTLTSAIWSSDKKQKEVGLAVDHWDLATGKARATFWAPLPRITYGERRDLGRPIFPMAALSADGKTVAWPGAEKEPKNNIGTAHVWEVGSLATSAPKLSEEPEKNAGAEQAGKKPAQDKLDGEQLRLTGHTGHVWTVCVSADGKRLLTSSGDKTLRLWDANTGKQLRVFEGHTERVVGAALSADGQRVLSGSTDKTVRLWDTTTGQELLKMTGSAGEVWSVAFGPEGQALSAGCEEPMYLWDLKTGKNTRVFTGHTSSVQTVAYSDKARLAATSSRDQSIRLWDLETGKEVRKLTGHSGNSDIRDSDIRVCFSSDGKRLVSGSSGDNSVRIWDVETGKELKRIDAPNACCAAFSPDGKRIVSGGYRDFAVRIWDAESGKELRTYEGHTSSVVGVAFFPDGKRIVSASYDDTARIWGESNLSEEAAKNPGAIFKTPGSYTLDVALTADGKLLARAGTGETVDLWDVASGKKLHTLKGHTAPLFKVAFSPDGKTLASATGGWGPNDCAGEVKLWDVATGKETIPVKGHRLRVWSMAFSADGKTLATSSDGPAAVKLWDVATGKEKMELGVFAFSLAFSPDGKTLAMGVGGLLAEEADKPGSVQFWDLTTGKNRASMPGHRDGGLSLVFTPDGKTLVSAGREGKRNPQLKLWDVATAKERATIAILGDTSFPFFPLVFTADGNTLISAMWIFDEKKSGLCVQHWELATGKARATFWAPFNDGSYNAGVYFAALSADGKTVAWGGVEEQGKKITGTAYVREVQSLATSPPKLPKDQEKPAPEKLPHDQAAADKGSKELQGEWVAVSGVLGNKVGLTPEQAAGFRVTIQGDRLAIGTDDTKLQGTFIVDSTKKPGWIDLKSTDAKTRGKTFPGVYAIEGGRLTLSLSDLGQDRPTGFTPNSKLGSLMHLVLEKQNDTSAPKSTAAQDKAKLQGTWKLVGATERGQAAREDKLAELRFILIFTGDKITVRNPKNGEKKEMGVYNLDASRSPKHLDSEQKDWLGKAIYAFDGDRLKIGVLNQRTSIQEPGGKAVPQETSRPKSFNEGLTLIFERQK